MLISRRTNTILLVLILGVGIGIVAMLASGARGGPLDPPGPPASTQPVVEPRTPIDHLPYAIAAPGSYVLTKNLSGAPATDGITVGASNVTLDLNGFTLTGAGSGSGVVATAGIKTGLVVRNGSITGWSYGIYVPGAVVRSEFSDLRVSGNASTGLAIGNGSVVRNVLANANNNGMSISETGVAGGTIVEDSNVSGNVYTGVNISASNVRLQRNVIDSNGASGVYVLPGTGWNEVLDNRIARNGNYGVWLDGYVPVFSSNNVVARNSLLGNTPAAVQNDGASNHVGPYVSDASLTGSNPWSNVVY